MGGGVGWVHLRQGALQGRVIMNLRNWASSSVAQPRKSSRPPRSSSLTPSTSAANLFLLAGLHGQAPSACPLLLTVNALPWLSARSQRRSVWPQASLACWAEACLARGQPMPASAHAVLAEMRRLQRAPPERIHVIFNGTTAPTSYAPSPLRPRPG